MDVREVYQIAGVGSRDPLALYRKYVEVDQQAFKAGQWDYDDPSFLCGKIVAALLEVDPLTVTAEEQNWFQEIHWFWNHHAISCALWKKKDKRKAQEYAARALELQPKDHPNHITRVLFHLVHNQPREARAFIPLIPDEAERNETAPWLIAQYESESWPLPKT